jgi:hypothetical protein
MLNSYEPKKITFLGTTDSANRDESSSISEGQDL